MSGRANLKVPTSEEARKYGSLGGKASGRSRRRKRQLREILQAMLQAKNEDGVPHAELVCASLIKEAISGNVRACSLIFERLEGKVPEFQKVEVLPAKSYEALSPEEVCDQLIAEYEAEIEQGRKESPYFMRHRTS